MSWAVEEWKEGLPTRALQKIQELEGQLDKLKKERQQRQFQLETLEAALQKQKQKVENEKTEGINLKRENQSLMEICENLEKTKQKISHDLQVKESQVNFQEGQLNSSKKQIEKLEQELKRFKSELERSQQAGPAADVSLNPCSTPQTMSAAPLTPSHYYSGSKYEDLQEKYNKEVEARKRLEAEVKVLQANRASQPLPPSTMNHRDIARHQASSSVFWPQEATPGRLSSTALRTPSRREFSAEPEGTPSRWTLQTGNRDANSSFCDNSSSSQLLDQLKAQNQELRSKIQDLELRLQGQEKELKGQGNKFHEVHLQLEKAKVELTEKEKVLNKSRDELVRTTAQYDQASAKSAALEQKLKKLTEDLSCQRQNSESARRSLEQRSKEKEKEFQEELCRQQRALQSLEQEGVQVKARLTQELQHARSAHGSLQAELDRVTAVKHQLEKTLDELRHESRRTEQALRASQAQEETLRRSVEELKEESSLVRGQSEQRAREAGRLEEELQAAREALSQSQRSAEEMRAKSVSQEAALRDLREKISQQERSLALEKLTRAVADLEKQRDCSQDLLKKREHHIEQLNEKLSRTEQESRAVLGALELKSQECEELVREKAQLSRCQSENGQRLHQAQAERESLQRRISHLETCLQEQQATSRERLAALELERGQLGAEVGRLQAALDGKVAEVGAQQRARAALQQEAEALDQQHREEMENMRWQVAQLARRVADREQELQALAGEIADRDQRCRDLSAECERLRGRARSRGSLLGASAARDGSPDLEQPSATDGPLAHDVGEQERRDAARSPLGPALSRSKVIALECALESQKQVTSELQKQCAELARKREEAEENLSRAERAHQEFVAETSQRIRELQEDTCAQQQAAALEDKGEELHVLTKQLEAQQAESEDVRGRNRLLGASLEELRLVSETLSAEKKEMDSVISLHREEIQELTRENGRLKEVNASLSQERLDLLQKSESLSLCIGEKEKSISELSSRYEQERLTLLQRCERTGRALEELSEKYKAGQEKSSQLERLLSECTRICGDRKVELEQLKETFAREHQACVAKLALAEERSQRLELDAAHPRAAGPPSCSQSEAEALKREVMALKEEQSEMQKEVLALSRENAHLRERVQSQRERRDPERPAGEPADATPRIALAVKGASPEGRGARQAHLGAKVRGLELRLRESELEKGHLRQEPQAARPPETSGRPDCDADAEGACEWAACGGRSAALEAEGGAATGDVAAEVEGLVGEVRPLDRERSCLHGELLPGEVEAAVGAGLPSPGPLGEEALAPGGPPPPPGGRVAELEALCQAYLQSLRRLEEQVERQGLLRAREVQELRQLLSSEREAREGLHRQQLSERAQWQQRLASVTAEMQSELEAERKQTEHLSLELELARLQLQGLDLSSRSLLGADPEGAARESESCDVQEPEGSPAASPRAGAPEQAPHGAREDQQDLSPEPGALGLPGHGPQGCTPAGSPEPSPSGPGAPAPVDFLGGQPTTEDLQARVQEVSRENVRLLHAVAERDRRIQGLLGEVEELGSKLESQAAQLAAKSAACLELGRVVEQLGKEKPDFSDARAAPASGGRGSGQGLGRWGGLGPGPHPGAQQGLLAASGEGAVAVERERECMGAQKAGLEQRAFCLGADLARVQAEKWPPEEDDAGRPVVDARLEQELSALARGGPGAESKGHGDPSLTPAGAEDSAPGAPGPCPDAAQGLSPPPRKPSSERAELPREEAPLLEQLRAVDGDAWLGQLARERERLAGKAARLQAQLSQSDAERLRVSRALEAALLEKAEVAARLSSTQGEAQQLRRGIEALRVRIEADERARRRVSKQLQDSERCADGLRERAERLERELQTAEDSQELLIVEAETAKAEADTLRTQAAAAAGRLQAVQEDLAALRADRESLEQQLQRERGRVSEADTALSSLRRVLEDKERESVQAAEESGATEEALRAQLAELRADVAALCRELETPGAGAQGPASPDARPPSAPGVEQLRGRLRAGAERLLQVSGQLQDSERQADRLRGQVADLQEQLAAAGQSHRQAAGEAETLRAKLEEMALGLHALESELVSREGEKEELRRELQEARGRVSALTAQNALLQEKEQEKEQMKEESRAAVDTLQAQLKELREEVAASCHELEAQRGREQDLGLRVDALELEKAQLRQGLEEAERSRAALQSSVSGLLEEVGDGKRKLAQKEEEVGLLEAQLQDHQQLVSELSRAEAEQQRWREREQEREREAQELRARGHALQDSLDALRASHQDLERELEEAKVQNATLVGKVRALALAETELQGEVRELEQKAAALKEEFSGEKSRLAGELDLTLEEIRSSEGQRQRLLREIGDLKQRLESEHKARLESEGRAGEEAAAWERRLQEAEQTHQALRDAHAQSQVEIQAAWEKLASSEERLGAQQAELGLLRSREEELSRTLAAAQRLADEQETAKADSLKHADQLRKENERAQGKMRLLIKSCRQLEEEKEALQKELAQRSAPQEGPAAGAAVDAGAEELAAEVKELKETLEARSKEADEYLDKYCALLISHEKLEQAKEMLETQLCLLRAQRAGRQPRSPSPGSAPEPSPAPPAVGTRSSSGSSRASGKRPRASGLRESRVPSTPSTPETFSKKSRRAVHSGPQPPEDTFEPEGLPEVVKKGFADIPTGKSSPHILRRTTLATRTSPRLAAQKLAAAPLGLNKENQAEPCRPRAGGSRPQKVQAAGGSPAEPGAALQGAADSPLRGLRARRGQPDTRPEAGPEAPGGENCRVQ